MIDSIIFSLPFPPTINNYWLQVGRRRILTKVARDYKDNCFGKILVLKKNLTKELLDALQSDNLNRRIAIFPPDKRRRDGTNLEKAIDDALVYGRLIGDDSQIKEWSGKMYAPDKEKKGYIIVELTVIKDPHDLSM